MMLIFLNFCVFSLLVSVPLIGTMNKMSGVIFFILLFYTKRCKFNLNFLFDGFTRDGGSWPGRGVT